MVGHRVQHCTCSIKVVLSIMLSTWFDAIPIRESLRERWCAGHGETQRSECHALVLETDELPDCDGTLFLVLEPRRKKNRLVITTVEGGRANVSRSSSAMRS